MLARVMGSGHELQVDGIGGGHPLTSKIAIVSRSTRPDADIDYLFAQAGVLEAAIDTSPNCGNMLAGVGPFAIEAGMVAATAPETRVRIHNVNTGKLIEAIVQTPGGTVTYEGDAAIDGVPGTAAPIRLSFLDAAGAKTGRLLPTGSVRDRIQGVEVTLHRHGDAAWCILRAADFGKTGHERPAELDADRAFFDAAGGDPPRGRRADGAGRRRRARHPQARAGRGSRDPAARSPSATSRRAPATARVAATGAVGIATACVMPGSLAQELAGPLAAGPDGTGRRSSTRPGRIPIELELAPPGAEVPVLRASLVRTARRLFAGSVFVPDPLPPHRIRETYDAQEKTHARSPRPPGLLAATAGSRRSRAVRRRPTRTGRSASWCPTPPAAGPTRSPA